MAGPSVIMKDGHFAEQLQYNYNYMRVLFTPALFRTAAQE